MFARAERAACARPARQVVTVAGTNGKGSVTAMVDAALRAGGHRVARFTSPHLRDLTERFVIDGRPVAESELVTVISDVRDCIAGLVTAGALPVQPTFFEVTTNTSPRSVALRSTPERILRLRSSGPTTPSLPALSARNQRSVVPLI